jgi:hypothetical protein
MSVQPPNQQSGVEEAPASPLMMFILAAVSSIMTATLGDPQLARLAAREAIDAYRVRNQHAPMTIGQIVAFAAAGLDSLRLSMPADVSLSMKLRLRGNANGLNRSSCGCADLPVEDRVFERTDRVTVRYQPVAGIERKSTSRGGSAPPCLNDGVAAGKTDDTLSAGTMGNPDANTLGDAMASAGTVLTEVDWADAMQSVAVSLQADAMTSSPGEREIDAMWIDALKDVGTELRQGQPPSDGTGGTRSGLLAQMHNDRPSALFCKSKALIGKTKLIGKRKWKRN